MSATSMNLDDRILEALGDNHSPQGGLPEVDHLMADFNERFYLVRNYGGHARVCQEVYDPEKKSWKVMAQMAGDFRLGYDNERVTVGLTKDGQAIKKGKGTVWLEHPGRKTFDRIVFEPEAPEVPGLRNLWRGFPYQPVKGDCSLYLNHLRENVCLNDPEKYDYLIGWMSYAVKKPNKKGQAAIIITGEQGVGKNVAAEGFANLFIPHRYVASKADQIVGRFNGHMRGKSILIADESFFAGNHDHARILKGLITGTDLTVENKGVDIETVPNVLHLIILSNEPWVVRADPLERRYLALHCGNAHRKDNKYFKAIWKQLESGGYEALMFHLKHEIDIKDFEVRDVPHTDELRSQMIHSLDGVANLLHHFLVNGRIPGLLQKANELLTIGRNQKISTQGGEMLVRLDVLENYARKDNRREWSRISSFHLQRFFEDHSTSMFRTRGCKVQRDKTRYSYRIFPSLAECRQMWDEKFGEYEWPETIDGDTQWIAEGLGGGDSCL